MADQHRRYRHGCALLDLRGVDRILTVLEGTLRLAIGEDTVTLSPQSLPYGFAGDVEAAGEPIGGSVRDLNVMVARERWRALVARIGPACGQVLAMPGATTVLVACGDVQIGLGDRSLHLGPLDAARFDHAPKTDVTLTSDSPVMVVTLDPV